jgi:hypothetical protein
MSNCSNCFNGCVDIISDKCIKYTGEPVEFIGITTGAPLSEVERRITDYLSTVLDGTGIIPKFDDTELCEAITDNLPTEGVITLNVILTALISTICDLKTQIDTLTSEVAALNS